MTETSAPAVTDETPETEETLEVSTAAPSNIFTRAGAMLREKSDLIATIAAQKKLIDELADSVAASVAKKATLENELAEYKASAEALSNLVSDLTAERKTVSEEAIDQVAALGFQAAALPAPTAAEEVDNSSEGIIAQMNACKTPAEATAFFRAHKKEIAAAFNADKARN